MKNVFYLFAIGLMLQTQNSFAQTTNQLCQQTYSQTISTCANALALLPANARPGAQKSCIQQAKAAKDACLVGSNSCINNCENSFNVSEAICLQTYNPDSCGTDLTCVALVNQELSDCTAAATTVLNG
jgi:hypothetical protein